MGTGEVVADYLMGTGEVAADYPMGTGEVSPIIRWGREK